MKLFLIGAIIGLTTQISWAQNIYVKEVDHEIVKQIVIERVSASTLSFENMAMNPPLFPDYGNNDTNTGGGSGSAIADMITTGEVTPGAIVNIAKDIWEMVKNNDPVIEAKTMTANALPRGISHWSQLEYWQPPKAEKFKITYKNALGMKIVQITIRLVYTHGGRVAGIGRYITNATIQYADVIVWGPLIFNSSVEVPSVINLGSQDNPLAGMQIMMNWTISQRLLPIQKRQEGITFFIAGDGRPSVLMD